LCGGAVLDIAVPPRRAISSRRNFFRCTLRLESQARNLFSVTTNQHTPAQLGSFSQHTFGIRLASARECQCLLEAKTDGDVMEVHVRSSGVRYAVIQASSNKDRPERLVIAYQVDCLRDLIAAPSIFGLGFASREEAMANLKGLASDAALRNKSLES